MVTRMYTVCEEINPTHAKIRTIFLNSITSERTQSPRASDPSSQWADTDADAVPVAGLREAQQKCPHPAAHG